MYNKKALSKATAELDKAKAPKKPKDIITDPMGQWKYPGEVTRIPSDNITMKGVGYPVVGVANTGQRQIMLPGADYTFPGADYVDEYPQMKRGGSKKKTKSMSGLNKLLETHPFFKNYKNRRFDPKTKHFQDGGFKTKLNKEEEKEFQKFYETLPENLQSDDPTYDIRGYWDGSGRPSEFDYSQPKEDDGYYHAFSINPNTGEYLKSPAHPTFMQAVEEDKKMGYKPSFNIRSGKWESEEVSPEYEDGGYIEADLTDEEIEEYRKGGFIVEDISVPELNQAQKGKTVKSKDGTVTNKITKANGDTVIQVKTKNGKYYEKLIKKSDALDTLSKLQGAIKPEFLVSANAEAETKREEKQAKQKFLKEAWSNYDDWSTSDKVSDRVGAFLNDPFGMTARAVTGEQAYIPGMAQGLHNHEDPEVRNRYLKELGYTPGEFDASDVQNMINPGYWASSFAENSRKGNVGTAALEGALMFLPHLPKGTISKSNIKSGAKMLKNDVKNAGEYITTKTPLKNAYKLNPYSFQKNLPENVMFRGIGEEGLEDAVKSGQLKSPDSNNLDLYWTSRFKVADSYASPRTHKPTGMFDTDGFPINTSSTSEKVIVTYPKSELVFSNRYTGNSPGINSHIQKSGYLPIDKAKFYKQHWLKGYKEVPKELPGSPNAVNDVVKQPWQLKELPGLHLKSTMEGQAISKIIEPKTGLINVEQALGIIGKESGGADKITLIKKGLGETLPKKMDYNDFRQLVQDQLIPLDVKINPTGRAEYGLQHIGYMDAPPMEYQALTLSNKNKFGRGSSSHGNPEETLGHIHFLRDAETPDVLTVTQIQSDAFQGTHRSSLKTKDQAKFSYDRQLEYYNKNKEKLEGIKQLSADTYQFADGQKISKSAYDNMFSGIEESVNLSKAELENFTQKQLLDKNHQERYLQELVDYAGKRGDVNKVRVPTSETAAKVQNYTKKVVGATEDWGGPMSNRGSVLTDYPSEHKTILKKYSEQPKTIKKLFGEEPRIVTDNKGNTWYEFDIPENFKKGKGEIKAFSMLPYIVPTAFGAGAAVNYMPAPKKSKQMQKGGMVTQLTPKEIQEYINQGYIVEDVEKPQMQSGGQLVYQLWEEKTGTPWAEAKKQGLTDGSYDQNIALAKKLESGTLSPKATAPVNTNIKSAFDYAKYDRIVNNMVSNGASLDNLVEQQIGTREGLVKRYPNLFNKPGNKPVPTVAKQNTTSNNAKPVFVKQPVKSKKPQLKVDQSDKLLNDLRRRLTPDMNQPRIGEKFVIPKPKVKSKENYLENLKKFQSNFNAPNIAGEKTKQEPIANSQYANIDLSNAQKHAKLNLPDARTQMIKPKPIIKPESEKGVFGEGSKEGPKVVKEDKDYAVINKLNTRLSSLDSTLQDAYYHYTNPKLSKQEKATATKNFKDKVAQRNKLINHINKQKESYAGGFDTWLNNADPVVAKVAQKFNISDQVSYTSYKLPELETYVEKTEKENEVYRTTKRIDEIDGNGKGSRWQFRVAASNDEPMKVQTYGTRSERPENLNIKARGSVMHFLDQSPDSGYMHENTKDYYRNLKPDGYVGVLEKQKDGAKAVKYIQKKDIPAKDLHKNTFLIRQEKFDNIDFDTKVEDNNFSGHTYWTKKGTKKPTIPISSGKDPNVYDYSSGQSVVYIFPYKGKTRYVHFAGSPNAIRKEGEEIKKLYKLKNNILTLGVADAGSYSSAIKGDITDKKLKDRNYGYFNRNGFTGAGMALVE